MRILREGTACPVFDGSKVRLYTAQMNPYGHRILLILEAKKIPYEVYYIDRTKTPVWFLKKSPHGKVPLLEVKEGCIQGSLTIADYLDETYSPQLHSRDSYQKARDRLLVESFNKAILGMFEAFKTNGAKGGKDILSNLLEFNRELENRSTPYFNGYKPGMVDYMIWPWVERLTTLEVIDKVLCEKFRHNFNYLDDWAEKMKSNSEVTAHSFSPLEYYEFYRDCEIIEAV